MENMIYPYQLPPLPYAYDALEPFIDAETMHYHHDKHFQTYVNNLNTALEPYPSLQKMTLDQLLRNPQRLPAAARTSILNNGGGVYNHSRYFQGLAPAGEAVHRPEGRMLMMINQAFGSYDGFVDQFSKQALAVFGSGYTYLVQNQQKGLMIVNVKNQDTTLSQNQRPLMLFDVWEHAYYLKYKNLRADYVKQVWNVMVFPVI